MKIEAEICLNDQVGSFLFSHNTVERIRSMKEAKVAIAGDKVVDFPEVGSGISTPGVPPVKECKAEVKAEEIYRNGFMQALGVLENDLITKYQTNQFIPLGEILKHIKDMKK